ncbi:NAD-dependent epimerase/dehydratase family protein [Marininema halotolerans]|uniref:UDP-glucose 4-epimerase n=1 Tax=Marininema halotolerans TaxID=1155944 RepID=A0A1I6P123_9BACL|nr:NAD-dependent epimerase/dehydratase family protein [Marininema halotolerans]SFS33778.1 UDP-glucose 4-epimerase [Marininema halotolerans]
MKVLVTGGAGFIGSHTVELLLKKGFQPVVVDNLSTGQEDYLYGEVPFYRLPIQDEGLMEVFERERPHAVIHLAANAKVTTSVKDPQADAATNIMGTLRVLEGCRQYGAKKIVYASSAAVYGNPQYLPIDENHPVNPLSPYGISKYTPESYLQVYSQLYGLRYTAFRYANVYGVRQLLGGEAGVIPILMNQLIAGETFTIDGDGDQSRDYINVEDVAGANVLALDKGDNEIFNLGTGQRTTLNELIALMESVLGKKIDTVHGPDRPGDIKDSYFDIQRVTDTLGWSPHVHLSDGLTQTYDYYQELALG